MFARYVRVVINHFKDISKHRYVPNDEANLVDTRKDTEGNYMRVIVTLSTRDCGIYVECDDDDWS